MVNLTSPSAESMAEQDLINEVHDALPTELSSDRQEAYELQQLARWLNALRAGICGIHQRLLEDDPSFDRIPDEDDITVPIRQTSAYASERLGGHAFVPGMRIWLAKCHNADRIGIRILKAHREAAKAGAASYRDALPERWPYDITSAIVDLARLSTESDRHLTSVLRATR